MARKKVQIDRDRLEASISKYEGAARNPTDLMQQVADDLAVGIGAVKGRIEDYGITLNIGPGKRGPIRQEVQSSGLDLTPFTDEGITVNTLADLLTSPMKDDETNLAIMRAIIRVRKEAGLPALSKEDFNRLKTRND